MLASDDSISKNFLLTFCKAEEYLYKNNVFILVSFEWRDFIKILDHEPISSHPLFSPIVTDQYAARMKHHTVRMHITKNMQDPIFIGTCLEDPRKLPVQSILLVAADFNAFCTSLRHSLGTLRGFAVAIADDSASRRQPILLGVTESYQKFKPPNLKIEFRDTRFRVADVSLQHDLLEPLRRVASPSMQVS